MLSAQRSLRRATASLLRCPMRRGPGPITRLSPAHCAAQRPLQLRAFSQQNDNGETFLSRVKDSLSDIKATATLMVQEASDLDLTNDEASTLLYSFAKEKRIDDCIGLLRYCEENHLSTWKASRLKAFRVLCDARELGPTLQLFESLCKDDIELKPWMVGRALEAATKLNRPEAVLTIFQRLVPKNCDVTGGVQVPDMLRQVCEQGEELDEFALRSIAIFADRAGEADLALEVLSLMDKGDDSVPLDIYMSVLEACGKQERWMTLVDVYNEMRDSLRPKLYSKPLALIIRAHARSGREELARRGPEIFTKYMKSDGWSTTPCNAVLEALLQSRQLDELFAMAGKMRQRGVELDSFSYKMMTLAHIERGTADQAKELLVANAGKMDDRGLECYRELAAYYKKVRGDPVEVCQLYLDMVQNGVQLDHSDWKNALELSLRLPDQAMYWRLRRQVQQDKSSEVRIPPRLLLPEREEKRKPVVALLQKEETQVQPEQVEPQTSITTTGTSPKLERLDVISDKWSAGEELTEAEAFKLLTHFANDRRIEEWVKLWRYCEERGLSPDSSSQRDSFRALCDANQFELALEVFEALRKDKNLVQPWMFGRALDAAIKLERKDVVNYVLRRLVRDDRAFDGYKVEASGKGVHAVVRAAVDRGVKLPKFALRSLASFADRSGDFELIDDIFSIMKSQDMSITLDVYGSVLNAYGRSGRWNDVMEVYNSMPESERARMHGTTRSWVMAASRHLKDEEPKALKAGARGSTSRTMKASSSVPKPQVSDVLLARKTFDDIKEQVNGGQRLSNNLASTLLSTMAEHGRVYDCIEMMSYFKKHGVRTKPFADRAAFTAFCHAGEFKHVLQVFDTLCKEGPLEPWAYGAALDAATNLDRETVITAIFRKLVPGAGNLAVGCSKNRVYDLLHEAGCRGVDVSEFALESLASFAYKAGHSDLALTVLSTMQHENMNPSTDVFGAAISSCCKDCRWNELIQVFEGMPEDLRANSIGGMLGAVIMAYTKTGDKALALRGLELFEDHKGKWTKFACNAALEALLETDQPDVALSLANDMTSRGVNWNSRTYRAVALAYVRSGLVDKARVFLSENAKQLQTDTVDIYRELIQHYKESRGDHLTACQLSVDFIENN